MALVVEIFYVINRGFVKTRFSETIFFDVSCAFYFCLFTTQMVTDDAKFFIKVIDSSHWLFQIDE